MRSLFQKLFNRKNCRKQYIPVQTTTQNIRERVWLIAGNQRFDVSLKQWILCQDPFIIGIWFESNLQLSHPVDSLWITNTDGSEVFAKLYVKPGLAKIETAEALHFFEVTQTELFQLKPSVWKGIIRRFQKNKNNELDFKNLQLFAGGFSYPRKVICVVFQDSDFLNFFPMDFQGYIAEEGLQILGLRNSNATLQRILQSKKILVCEVDAKHKNVLYDWGNHHGTQNIDRSKLQSTTDSPRFHFPIPGIATSCMEVEIIEHLNLGSHTLMIGRNTSLTVIKKEATPLHHLHCLQYTISAGYYTQV